jgi:hypothetical protein
MFNELSSLPINEQPLFFKTPNIILSDTENSENQLIIQNCFLPINDWFYPILGKGCIPLMIITNKIGASLHQYSSLKQSQV